MLALMVMGRDENDAANCPAAADKERATGTCCTVASVLLGAYWTYNERTTWDVPGRFSDQGVTVGMRTE
jgi:hypothetical protein